MLRIFTTIFVLQCAISCTQQTPDRSRLLDESSTPTEINDLQVRYASDGRIMLAKFPETSSDKLLGVRKISLKGMSGTSTADTKPTTLMHLTVEAELSILRNGVEFDCNGPLDAQKKQQNLNCKQTKSSTPTTKSSTSDKSTEDLTDRSISGKRERMKVEDEGDEAVDQLYALLGPSEGGYGTTVLFSWSKDPKKAGDFKEINYRVKGEIELSPDQERIGDLGYRFSIEKLNVIAQIGSELPQFECLGVNYQTPSKCAPQKEPAK